MQAQARNCYAEDLIEWGFNEDFVNGLTDGQVEGLHTAWDAKDPDVQFDNLERFLYFNHIECDIEDIMEE